MAWRHIFAHSWARVATNPLVGNPPISRQRRLEAASTLSTPARLTARQTAAVRSITPYSRAAQKFENFGPDGLPPIFAHSWAHVASNPLVANPPTSRQRRPRAAATLWTPARLTARQTAAVIFDFEVSHTIAQKFEIFGPDGLAPIFAHSWAHVATNPLVANPRTSRQRRPEAAATLWTPARLTARQTAAVRSVTA
jgi:hypothetical protein